MSNSNANGRAESYAGRFGAIMSMAGMCVGMGNVWRFPYMVGQYGGGAFVLAYLLCIVIVVVPLAIMECGIGKGFGKGLIDVYSETLRSRKAGRAVGGLFSFGYYSMNFYFFFIVGASVFFAFASATSMWNTVPAVEIYDKLTANYALLAIISVVLVLFVSFVVYKGVEKGIEAVSKVMMPLMIAFLLIAILFGVFFIDGIEAGYEFMFKPDFSKLLSFDVWVAAMGQACFSVGVGAGCILTYGSHLNKKSDVTMNMLTVALLDTSIGVLAGMAIIPACIAMGLNPESGSKLIFVVLPSLFELLPAGALLGVLVFVAIFFAGITSAIAQLEVIVASFIGSFNWSRLKTVFIFGGLNVIAAVIAVYSTAFFDFWNMVSGNYVFIVSAGVGAIVFGWVFGVERIRTEYLNPTSDIQLGKWYTYFTKFVAIPIMLIMMLNSLFPFL
ncbi:sodium-dependent transporter [Anaerotignum sp.]|uniref:sodium-dependent transporter n=1 Tax=Anaerotignum sp. TaxID=2039241 RepID=UPI0027152D22|nr:sodium-dependent transporter [Anaerotignum sp.]